MGCKGFLLRSNMWLQYLSALYWLRMGMAKMIKKKKKKVYT